MKKIQVLVLVIIVVCSFVLPAFAEERIWFVFDMGTRADIHQQSVPDGLTPADGFVYRVAMGKTEDSLVELCSFHYGVSQLEGKIAQYQFDETSYEKPVWIPVAIDVTAYAKDQFLARLILHQSENATFDWAVWGAPRFIKGDLPALEKAVAGQDIPIDIHNLPSGVKELVDLSSARTFLRTERKHVSDGVVEDVERNDLVMVLADNDLAGRVLTGVFTHPPLTAGGIDLFTYVQWKLEVSGNSISAAR